MRLSPVQLASLVSRVRFSPSQLARLFAAAVDWDESKHPRVPPGQGDPSGQFTGKDAMVVPDPKNEAQQARLRELKLPPAWKDVRISLHPNAKLQATGIDSKGRKQYVYSAEHTAAQAAEKFARLQSFYEQAPKVERAALLGLHNGDPTAAATYLISQTGFRVGSDKETGAATKAYGASTLEGRHVRVNGNQVEFAFTGKKGVAITKTIDNPALAKYIAARGAKPNERVFEGTDIEKVRDFVKEHAGEDFKVKDFRTLHGTSRALELIEREMRSPPKNAKERTAAFTRVKKGVAEHLGNTPAVAFASYIDPAVWGRLEVVK